MVTSKGQQLVSTLEEENSAMSLTEQTASRYASQIKANEDAISAFNEAIKYGNVEDSFDVDLDKSLSAIRKLTNSDSGGNEIYDYLVSCTKEGENASDAIKRLGINLDSLDIRSQDIDDYFANIAKEADSASNAIAEFDGSLSSVTSAIQSDNSGVDYAKAAQYASTIKDLYKAGKVGTDDFQSFVEYISPDQTSLQSNLDEYLFDADAYVEQYQNLKKKLADILLQTTLALMRTNSFKQ